MIDLRITGRVQSLHLEPGDRILVTLDSAPQLQGDWLDELKSQIESHFPGHEVILLNGLSIASETRTK